MKTPQQTTRRPRARRTDPSRTICLNHFPALTLTAAEMRAIADANGDTAPVAVLPPAPGTVAAETTSAAVAERVARLTNAKAEWAAIKAGATLATPALDALTRSRSKGQATAAAKAVRATENTGRLLARRQATLAARREQMTASTFGQHALFGVAS